MAAGDFNEVAAHDAAGLDRKVRIFWDLGFIIETQMQDRLPIFYRDFFYHPHIYAGVVNGISLRQAFCLFEIGGHVVTTLPEKHHATQMNHDACK